MKFLALSVAGLAIAAAIMLTRPAPPPPKYDFARMTACLDERGFPFDTLAGAKRSLRFCVGFDQAVGR